MNRSKIYKVFPHIIYNYNYNYKYKSPIKIKMPIKTINCIFEKKNIDINDIDYSDNFWKKSEKINIK
tara:strand:- start:1411 stop:1611 length:201 start_codon:yes stop_codon:yes gene_type:complete